ncbi:fasciclin domain-containing protein [Yoonia sp. R2331]|uniref:fasciclin domain-containing protein n=1 Tax=Yoonia sp. R2331 TaxID=3237238 RepID=UPI0034E583DB
MNPSIAAIASGPDFSVLLGAVKFLDANLGTNLVTTLSNPGTLTVFAPTNAAFGSLAADLGFAGDPADADAVLGFLAGNVPAETLRDVVQYHVLPEVKTAADIAADPTLTTALGPTITADLPTLVDNEPDLIDPSLVATDIMASNGVVHVIDKVLLPIDLPGNDAPTITDIAVASGPGFDNDLSDFDILREAVVAADLAGALADPNADLTVFAPNDAAFVGLAQALGFTGDNEADAFGYIVDALRLLSNGDDPIPLLTNILLYHVAPESLQASQVLALDQIPTLLGVDLGRDGAALVDGDPDFANPNLVATDIQAANGVLHVIDGVLVPIDILQSSGRKNDVDFLIGDDRGSITKLGRDNDYIDAKGGWDVVFAGKGHDVVLAGSGRDFVWGGKGHDVIKGEGGNDVIKGGRGHDEISGGAGFDFLTGGRGRDTFIFKQDEGVNVISDFDRRGNDTIDLSAFGIESYADLAHNLSDGWRGTTIHLDGTDIFLSGTRLHSLTEDDFIL